MSNLNSPQHQLLGHYNNGDFMYLDSLDAKKVARIAVTDCGDLLLPYLLSEMEDITDLSVGVDRIRSVGNRLVDLADEMEDDLIEDEEDYRDLDRDEEDD